MSKPSPQKPGPQALESSDNLERMDWKKGFIRWFLAELRPFLDSLHSPWFYLALGLVLLGLILVYQVPFKQKVDLTQPPGWLYCPSVQTLAFET